MSQKNTFTISHEDFANTHGVMPIDAQDILLLAKLGLYTQSIKLTDDLVAEQGYKSRQVWWIVEYSESKHSVTLTFRELAMEFIEFMASDDVDSEVRKNIIDILQLKKEGFVAKLCRSISVLIFRYN
ncbi:hypothetical protein L4D76_23800 [Photobacterium sagamiensis]|uniref:hypothetical protein n=1 Tax=Photobacterium sagamiensis TaxID=2910241 RepID=UPI003D14042B